ncbi:YybH family protein [Microbacterium sp. H83]|uniref:YybH family protein n=1 Tax=Microbacterium sp. H83 TaxID=1827324 RepID=UPI0007F339AF|nr:nuclear transport factor 2 family protein [Microbacterium sp. H83]OAN41403.1 hypothetical protein A4X16_11220 [Microbacterium sp. H83]
MKTSKDIAASAAISALDEWARNVTEHRPDAVAAGFTEDALFQGFDPEHATGRASVQEYYAKQPVGLRASYELKAVRQVSDGNVIAFARAVFVRPDGEVIPVFLTVLLERHPHGWLISHYHVSKIS